ncbi:pupal cuticle protein PCP52-like [Spodoptera litura]|uniref:Pupal cuticle protein PCP52-like n=1 Tax=Spodoptera litura TaxID=69820 RepID=A0A9J7DUT7_SPOLT|nr:pupal cuticle protein PCP52-like [Spodoptera litura]
MRVLIVSALFAVAAAAPSGLYAPVIVPAVRAVAVPAAIPTISPGDIQAAAIDAQVQAQDQAQAAADKARELAEQANENINEKAITDATGANEQNLEAFWSAEDKKWQAVDALKTAEAQIDGAVASNANNLAKSAVSGVAVPYVAAVGSVAPIVAPIPPVVYSGYVAPSSYSSQTLITGQEIKTEIKEENKEAAVKTAEPAPAEAAQAEGEKKVEGAESPALKAAENLKEKPAFIAQPLIAPIGLPNVYRYDVAVPSVGAYIGQPILKYAAVQPVPGVLTPTFVNAWK